MTDENRTTEQPAALEVNVADTITIKASLGYELKRKGQKRPGVEGLTGDDLHRKPGRWFQKERVIDRERDRYSETVVDPETGAIVHHCEEPLSRHRGHGRAKKLSK